MIICSCARGEAKTAITSFVVLISLTYRYNFSAFLFTAGHPWSVRDLHAWVFTLAGKGVAAK
jgi:hypothetical protein